MWRFNWQLTAFDSWVHFNLAANLESGIPNFCLLFHRVCTFCVFPLARISRIYILRTWECEMACPALLTGGLGVLVVWSCMLSSRVRGSRVTRRCYDLASIQIPVGFSNFPSYNLHSFPFRPFFIYICCSLRFQTHAFHLSKTNFCSLFALEKRLYADLNPTI